MDRLVMEFGASEYIDVYVTTRKIRYEKHQDGISVATNG
jgi:hypothetical protein